MVPGLYLVAVRNGYELFSISDDNAVAAPPTVVGIVGDFSATVGGDVSAIVGSRVQCFLS